MSEQATTPWSGPDLELIGGSGEVDIAVLEADGTPRRWTPIWVVCADDQVYVRSWYRRDTGWVGAALRSGRALIRAPRLQARVVGPDVGQGPAGLRAGVDAAYRSKYGTSGSTSMVADPAAATTLRLDRQPAA